MAPAANRLMVHLAINEGDQHDVVHWLEPVTDVRRLLRMRRRGADRDLASMRSRCPAALAASGVWARCVVAAR